MNRENVLKRIYLKKERENVPRSSSAKGTKQTHQWIHSQHNNNKKKKQTTKHNCMSLFSNYVI